MANEIRPGIDGMYAVYFVNSKAYDEKKILEIFGRYGHVLSVRFTDHENEKVVFVRYKEYNEVKCCLNDLNKTNELSVRIAFPSKKYMEDAPKQQSRTPTFSGDKYSSKNQSNGSDSMNYKKPFHKNFKKGNRQIKFYPKPGHYPNVTEQPSTNFEETKQNDEDPLDDQTVNRHSKLGSDSDTQSTGDAKEKVSDDSRAVKRSGKEDNLENSDHRGQILQNSPINNGIICDVLPPLVDSESLPQLVDGQGEVYAKDVIVANLPPTVDEWDVVCLVRRHDLNPVHVSAIETTKIKHNILFCHLWMENDYEAKMAELVLRGVDMQGNTLLVARAEKLLSAFCDSPSTFATT